MAAVSKSSPIIGFHIQIKTPSKIILSSRLHNSTVYLCLTRTTAAYVRPSVSQKYSHHECTIMDQAQPPNLFFVYHLNLIVVGHWESLRSGSLESTSSGQEQYCSFWHFSMSFIFQHLVLSAWHSNVPSIIILQVEYAEHSAWPSIFKVIQASSVLHRWTSL